MKVFYFESDSYKYSISIFDIMDIFRSIYEGVLNLIPKTNGHIPTAMVAVGKLKEYNLTDGINLIRLVHASTREKCIPPEYCIDQ